MLSEFSRSLRKEFEKRLREKRYMVETIMLEYDMASGIVFKQMEAERKKELRVRK